MGRPQETMHILENGESHFLIIPVGIFERLDLDSSYGGFWGDFEIGDKEKTVKQLIEHLDSTCKISVFDKKWQLKYKDYYDNILKPKLLKFKKRSIVKN